MKRHELIVIGGGPAGLAAATAAAESGVETLLLDEQSNPGGQIYRSVGNIPESRAKLLGPDYQYGKRLVDRFNQSGAAYLPETALWNLNRAREIGILRGDQASLLKAERIIIASGAMERPVAFPGWTLPGVMSAGGGQILLKGSGIVPDDGVVLAGVGPLLLLLGWQYLHAGVPIKGILDLSPYGNILRALPHLPGALMAHHYILKGLRYQMQLKMAGVKFYGGVTEFHAVGGDLLEAVEFTQRRGRKRIETELLLSHFGVIPDSHLSRCAGCEHQWDANQLCWRPVTDAWDNSSIEGVGIVGDGNGIGGAVAARHAGRISGFEAARALGYITEAQRNEMAREDQRWMRDDLRVRPFLEARYHPPTELLSAPADETIVCRCEEVRAGEVRRAIHAGHKDTNQVKFQTRCGMGPCQGRQCDNAVSQLVARETGDDAMLKGGYRIRPPIRPLTIEQLAGLETE